MQYHVIKRTTVDELIAEVNNYLGANWKPLGNPIIVFDPTRASFAYFQALTRYD